MNKKEMLIQKYLLVSNFLKYIITFQKNGNYIKVFIINLGGIEIGKFKQLNSKH